MAKKSTYGTLAKWFKWSSLIIILVPIVEVILLAINLGQGYTYDAGAKWFDKGIFVLAIISLVCAVIWLILNIIMFFAAGTVRNDGPSPLKIRIGLLIAIVLVLAPIILGLISYYAKELGVWAAWVAAIAPIVGYTIGAIMGSKLQHNLN